MLSSCVDAILTDQGTWSCNVNPAKVRGGIQEITYRSGLAGFAEPQSQSLVASTASARIGAVELDSRSSSLCVLFHLILIFLSTKMREGLWCCGETLIDRV